MYEGMKPKDAARVFDRLEMSVLYDIASQIAPRKMSDILGLMQPEAAERLTVELARRAGTDKSTSTAELPKIEGKCCRKSRTDAGYPAFAASPQAIAARFTQSRTAMACRS